MKLTGVERIENYLYSEWQLTYRVGWKHICSAASLIYRYTDDPELMIGDADGERKVTVGSAEEILALEEAGRLSVRGASQILKAPVWITFFNQTDFVRASVLCVNEEFEKADYKAFNLSMCQFMDSMEIAMYR